MQKSSRIAKISTKVVGGLLFLRSPCIGSGGGSGGVVVVVVCLFVVVVICPMH